MNVCGKCTRNLFLVPNSLQSFRVKSANCSPSLISGVMPSSGAGGPNYSSGGFDWSSAYSAENRLRTVSILDEDRFGSKFTFDNLSDGCRKAAVLVPLCFDVKGRPGIVYNLRSETLNTHKGEISFPGGTMDPEDNDDPVTAALRETHEELGITRDEVDIWTTCRVMPTVSSKMGVVPVVGLVKSGPVDPRTLSINPDEVDHAFVITLEHLCDPNNWSEMSPPGSSALGGSFTIPIFTNMTSVSEGLHGVQLWGLTAFITHLVLSALLPGKYKRKVGYLKLMKRKSSPIESKSKQESSNISKL